MKLAERVLAEMKAPGLQFKKDLFLDMLQDNFKSHFPKGFFLVKDLPDGMSIKIGMIGDLVARRQGLDPLELEYIIKYEDKVFSPEVLSVSQKEPAVFKIMGDNGPTTINLKIPSVSGDGSRILEYFQTEFKSFADLVSKHGNKVPNRDKIKPIYFKVKK